MDPNARMQTAVNELLDRLDHKQLRPLRKAAFQCSAKCCDAPGSAEDLQRCVQQCQAKVLGVEQGVGQELEMFQQRLQRCAMTCSDKAQEKMPTDPAKQTPELLASLQKEAEACANRCVDEHMGSLSKIYDRIASAVKNS